MTKVLRPRFAEVFEAYGVWLVIIPPIALLVTPLVFIWLFVGPAEVVTFYTAVLEQDKFFTLIVPCLILLPITMAFLNAVSRSRVELSDAGIRFVSGAPDIFKGQVDWQLSWDDVDDVQLNILPMSQPLTAALSFYSSGPLRRLIAWQWVEPGNKQPIPRAPLFKGRAKHYQDLIAGTPLVLAMKAHGKLSTPGPESDLEEQQLHNANAGSKIIAVVFVALVAYFIGDSYFGLQEYYAGRPPWAWLVVAGCLGTAAGWLGLQNAETGSAQNFVIALLFGSGLALAAYPGLLRVNAWLDTEGLVDYDYALGQNDTWSANSEIPALVFDVDSRYWNQFEPGDTKTFQLRNGGLGFYQVNMAPIYADQREFYDSINLSLVTDETQDP